MGEVLDLALAAAAEVRHWEAVSECAFHHGLTANQALARLGLPDEFGPSARLTYFQPR